MYRLSLLTILLLLSFCMFSCKKEINPDVISSDRSLEERQVLDSIFLYASQVYYWNTSLPKYGNFNFKKYTDGNSMSNYTDEIFDIVNYTVNPQTGKSFEYYQDYPLKAKFSTIINRMSSANQNNSTLSDIGYNYGITFVSIGNNEIYVEYVIKNSPAEVSGLKRGMKVEEINGRKSENTEDFYKYIKAAFDNNTVELFLKQNPASIKSDRYTLRKLAYVADPVNKVSVLDINNIKIGYISYLKFSSPKGRDESLNSAFNYFRSEEVKELIVDLRYNGGGDVSTSENFANLIIPERANGRIMRKEKYNNLMQEGHAEILSQQLILNDDGSPAFIINGRVATLADGDYSLEGNTEFFNKTRGIKNLSRVYFIVSKKTASASELLINCLRPYMQVKLIGVRTTENVGEPIKTFGKPMGFFPIKIKSYLLYLSLFQNLNANNEGGYFTGMGVDITAEDDIKLDFGDLSENAIQAALSDMGHLPKTIITKNKILSSKPLSWGGTSMIKKEIFGSAQSEELVKAKIKLKK